MSNEEKQVHESCLQIFRPDSGIQWAGASWKGNGGKHGGGGPAGNAALFPRRHPRCSVNQRPHARTTERRGAEWLARRRRRRGSLRRGRSGAERLPRGKQGPGPRVPVVQRRLRGPPREGPGWPRHGGGGREVTVT